MSPCFTSMPMLQGVCDGPQVRPTGCHVIGDPGLTNSALQLRTAQSATLQLSGCMPNSALWVESAGRRKILKLKDRRELAHVPVRTLPSNKPPVHRSLRSLHTLQQPAHHRTPRALPYIGATCARRHGSRCMARSSSLAASAVEISCT